MGFLFTNLDPLRRVPVADRDAIDVPIQLVDETLVGAAKSDRVLDETLQHRLESERRAADDLEDLTRRRLLVEGLG